ncbi:MAG: hypothetical protein ACRDDX_12570 [Cellulosilyticaceae bacterium]
MKLYSNTAALSGEAFGQMLDTFYPLCDKVSIYFPNDGEDAVMTFKNKFLQAIELCEIEDELSVLEPKEGFSMVIASIAPTHVQALLKEIHPSFHLSFGLIKDETLVFFVGEEGEIAIDVDDASVVASEVFNHCTKLDA